MNEKVPLEQVDWIDAESECSWENTDDVKKWSEKDFIVTEVGWVIHENVKMIVITSQVGSDGSIGNRTKIPKKWIVGRKKLKFAKEYKCRRKSES